MPTILLEPFPIRCGLGLGLVASNEDATPLFPIPHSGNVLRLEER